MVKLDSTAVTLAIAGVVAVAIGVIVNNQPWKGAHQAPAISVEAHANTASPRALWAASATGRIEPKSGELRIGSTVPGRIVEVPVKINDHVSAGDLLVKIDDEDLRTKINAANAEVQVRVRERDEEEARGLALERRKAEDAVAAAERALFDAREERDAAVEDLRAGRSNDETVSAARKKVTDAQAKLESERKNLDEVSAKPNMPLPTRLESGLSIARADLSSAEIALERTRIRAPIDGVVLNVLAKEGELAAPSPDNALAIVGDLSGTRVRAEVEERDAPKVRVGQRVIVRADAYPGRDFEGVVSSVAQSLGPARIASRGPRRPNDVEVLEVIADLDGPATLLTGMRVDVFFKLDTTAGSVTTPKTN
jgi:HlyD family secretion protein